MRMIDYQKAQIAAESGLEYGHEVKEAIINNQLTLTQRQIQTILNQMPPPPSIGGYVFTPRSNQAFRSRPTRMSSRT